MCVSRCLLGLRPSLTSLTLWGPGRYKKFLIEIGYLLPEGPSFQVFRIRLRRVSRSVVTERHSPLNPCCAVWQVDNGRVDPEIASTAGAQLVVPIDNARYALNAANARWGSLLDALYGTNVVDEEGGAGKAGAYNPVRGAKVFQYCHRFLDEVTTTRHPDPDM